VTEKDFNLWKEQLEAKPNARFKLYPALNHLLIAGSGPSLPEEYIQPGFVSEEVVGDLADWMLDPQGHGFQRGRTKE
jgi:uncharacterized protein